MSGYSEWIENEVLDEWVGEVRSDDIRECEWIDEVEMIGRIVGEDLESRDFVGWESRNEWKKKEIWRGEKVGIVRYNLEDRSVYRKWLESEEEGYVEDYVCEGCGKLNSVCVCVGEEGNCGSCGRLESGCICEDGDMYV